MCLIIDKKQCPNGYKVAKKNIPCYKVLLKNCSGRFETPCIKLPVDIKTGIEADEFQLEPYAAITESTIANVRIDKGIHSCTNLERARIMQNTYLCVINVYCYVGVIIRKAYIPKGTKYWVGKNHEFCSERIIFAEK